MSKPVLLSDIFAMLDECIPGHTRREGDHYWSIRHPDGQPVFPKLPKGKHGANQPATEIGYLRRLVRLFDIPECAGKFFAEFRPQKPKKKKAKSKGR